MYFNVIRSYLSTEVLLGAVAFFVAYVVLALWGGKKRKFPDGPWGLPIVGYLPYLDKMPHLQLYELSKKYGSVFSLRLGFKNVIILNDVKSIKEAFGKPETLGKPEVNIFSLSGMATPFFEHGRLWQEHRRFAVQSLKDLGLGKSVMHDRITDEIEHFLNILSDAKGKPILLKKILTPSMSNNICSLVIGKRLDYEDPSRKILDQSLEDITRILGQTSYRLFFPILQSIPILNKVFRVEELEKAFHKFRLLISKEIEDHKLSLHENEPTDYISKFLIEKEARSGDKDSTFNENVLLGNVNTLFGAGSETVQTTLSWCLYTMAAYPAIQEKVQKEIDEIIGSERFPTFSDQKSMPYTQSVLQEVHRQFTIVPVNLLRMVLEDTNIAGYDVPKGTFILANFWAAHHSPAYWEKPNEFMPERFLSKDKKSIIKFDAYMPFSYGKRNCPGEGLAILEVFLYFAAILQKFKLRFPEGQKVDFIGELDITYHVKPFNLCFLPRHQS